MCPTNIFFLLIQPLYPKGYSTLAKTHDACPQASDTSSLHYPTDVPHSQQLVTSTFYIAFVIPQLQGHNQGNMVSEQHGTPQDFHRGLRLSEHTVSWTPDMPHPFHERPNPHSSDSI